MSERDYEIELSEDYTSPKKAKLNGVPRNYSSSLELYLKNVADNELLSREEEIETIIRAGKGDRESFDKIIESNLGFVISVAKKYQGVGLPLEDLISEGNIGLIRAIRTFDEEKGAKFITYAVWWIRQSILEALNQKTRLIRFPVNRVIDLFHIKKTSLRLGQIYGREPNAEEIAYELDKKTGYVEYLQALDKSITSLDDYLTGDNGDSLLDKLEDKTQEAPDSIAIRNELRELLEESLSKLTEIEAEVLRLHYGMTDDCAILSLADIGRRLGLSRERIRQIKDTALGRLRRPSNLGKLANYKIDS